jgi:hypothetical protein
MGRGQASQLHQHVLVGHLQNMDGRLVEVEMLNPELAIVHPGAFILDDCVALVDCRRRVAANIAHLRQVLAESCKVG